LRLGSLSLSSGLISISLRRRVCTRRLPLRLLTTPGILLKLPIHLGEKPSLLGHPRPLSGR